MNGERGLGAAQFGVGSGGSSGGGANSNGSDSKSPNNYQKQYNYHCCSAYQNIGRVQVTAKILFGSVAAIQSVNAEKCRKK